MPRGFTLPQILIDLFLFSAIAVAIFSSLVFLQSSINLAKLKIQAVELANQKIEEYRNMPYDSLATQYGTIYPPGQIPDTQTVNIGNTAFTVQTIIKYIDDPYDGDAQGTIQGKPQDFYSYDYKKIEVKIAIVGNATVLANLTTNVAAKAAETATNSGILSLKVLNSGGQPFANSQVSITNSNPSPAVNIQTFTDTQGLVVVPLLPPDTQNGYHIVATAANNSTDSTNPQAPQHRYPVQPDLNILAQQVVNQTLSIDSLANFNLTVKNLSDTILPNIPISVTSNKLTYINPTVYKYQQSFNSDINGTIVIQSIEWDSYSLTTQSPYIISAVSPYQPVAVNAGTNTEATIYLTTSTTAPTLTKTEPLTAPNNEPQTLTFTGTKFSLTGASAILLYENPPGPTPTPGGIFTTNDIAASEITVSPDQTELVAIFDFTNKMPGTWEIRITNPNGEFVKQPKGLTITVP